MRRSILAVVPAVLLLAPDLSAGNKRVPEQLALARYVALGFDTGDRFLSEDDVVGHGDEVLPEELAAVAAIRDLIEQSDRFLVTTRPQQAQILIAVRTGRRATVRGAGPVGGPSRGRSFGGEISSNVDMLSVYESSGGRPGMLLWRETQGSGRPGFPHRLFEQFVSDVASAAKKP